MKLKTFLATLGVGIGLMYFMDPQQGSRRRAQVRDQVNRWIGDLDTSIDVESGTFATGPAASFRK